MKAVFVGGVPRSGTTLLGSALGSHPHAIVTPESPFVPYGIVVARTLSAESPETWQEGLLEWLAKDFRFSLWNLDLDRPARATLLDARDVGDFFLRLTMLYAGRTGRPNPDIWIDHTPANTRFAALLRAAFTEARFIHIIRDARAVVASVLPLEWGPGSAIGAAKWWAEWLAPGLAAARAWPDEVLEVRYESLVADPSTTLRNIAEDFLDLEYKVDLADRRGLALPSYTRRQHALVDRPYDTSRIDGWRTSLKPAQIQSVERRVGGLLATLGYLDPTIVAVERTPPREHVVEMFGALRQAWSLSVRARTRRAMHQGRRR
jgi:hypothetical protein